MDLPSDASKDQANVPNGYYRRNTGMLHMLSASPQSSSFTPINLTDDELRKLAIDKLSIALQAIDPVLQPEMTRKLAAEVKDRLDGKPGQQMTIDQNLNVVTVNAQISFVKAQPILDNNLITIENTKNQ
jgi:hypothetical protein